MWGRIRGRLWSALGFVVALAWFVGAVEIATGVLGFEARRGNRWVVMLIWFAPIGLVLAVTAIVGELRLRRRKGPPVPGRHSR